MREPHVLGGVRGADEDVLAPPTRSTTVMENTSHDTRLIAQHGLSLLIEGEGRKFVYDTGQSPRFLLNARALGVDLSGADALILSHGHWDHTGGAPVFDSSRIKKNRAAQY